jgi:hypothetical protein
MRSNKSNQSFLLLMFAFFFSFPSNIYARSLESYYQKLKPMNFERHRLGLVCEKIAAIRLQDDYPRYTILTNLVYKDERGEDKGEIDAMVRSVADRIVLVTEVKCRKNTDEAIVQATEQLTRFKDHVKELQNKYSEDEQDKCKVDFVVNKRKIQIPCSSFDLSDYRIYLPRENAARQPHRDLGFTFHELEKLTGWLSRR